MTLKRCTSTLGLSLMFVVVVIVTCLGTTPHSIAQARPAGTNVGGVITQSTTWDAASSPYVLNTSVLVTNGVTLTLEPGVIVEGGQNHELRVLGTLNAIGTVTQPITLTAAASNNPAGWPGLLFDGPLAAGELQHVSVRDASSDYGNATGMCNSIDARNVLTHEVHLANSSITGFDGGLLAPGQIYRKQFSTNGTYTYSDGAGHTAQVIVVGARVYLPLVLKNH